ncbi:MAG: type II toxin-antitoxin system YafQ family toxin [Proteobacteria bacterium]|jgi:mRNA interferase YafQ|nr:type II toxin-antitoxin system YafQ family toxin [Pseudomonadota bacterium]
MRTIDYASSFKRDYKREKLSGKYKNFDEIISDVFKLLLDDIPLPERYSDHELIGDWLGYRECHIKPDLLLIYRKPDIKTLRLARLGSHSELFG